MNFFFVEICSIGKKKLCLDKVSDLVGKMFRSLRKVVRKVIFIKKKLYHERKAKVTIYSFLTNVSGAWRKTALGITKCPIDTFSLLFNSILIRVSWFATIKGKAKSFLTRINNKDGK